MKLSDVKEVAYEISVGNFGDPRLDVRRAAIYCEGFVLHRSDSKTTMRYLAVLWEAALWNYENTQL